MDADCNVTDGTLVCVCLLYSVGLLHMGEHTRAAMLGVLLTCLVPRVSRAETVGDRNGFKTAKTKGFSAHE